MEEEKEATWACSACTFLNDASSHPSVCAMCFTWKGLAMKETNAVADAEAHRFKHESSNRRARWGEAAREGKKQQPLPVVREVKLLDQFGSHYQDSIRSFNTPNAICGYISIAVASYLCSADLQASTGNEHEQVWTFGLLQEAVKLLNEPDELVPRVEAAMHFVQSDRLRYIESHTDEFGREEEEQKKSEEKKRGLFNVHSEARTRYMKDWVANYEISDWLKQHGQEKYYDGRTRIHFVRQVERNVEQCKHEERRRLKEEEQFHHLAFFVESKSEEDETETMLLTPLEWASTHLKLKQEKNDKRRDVFIMDLGGHFAVMVCFVDGDVEAEQETAVLLNTTQTDYHERAVVDAVCRMYFYPESINEDTPIFSSSPSSSSLEQTYITMKQRRRKQRRPEDGAQEAEALLSEAELAQTEYFFKDGLRFVRPYHHQFRTYTKERWLGRPLLPLLTAEFRGHSESYYKEAIARGDILLNGRTVEEETILQKNDMLTQRIHRHEPPVSAEPIQVISIDDDLVVVNKPSSIPVHPAGRYRYNTVLFILAKEHSLNNLHCVHRLDRLTSGILLLARSRRVAQALSRLFVSSAEACPLKKVYVARVKGEFPRQEEVVVDRPIHVVNHREGTCKVAGSAEEEEASKSATTTFGFHSYDPLSDTSIVYCSLARGGRTHQIRLHLQWLGFPIANDPIYGPGSALQTEKKITNGEEKQKEVEEAEEAKDGEEESKEGGRCNVCGEEALPDPSPEELCIWLHAYSYSYHGKWSFCAGMPSWAIFPADL
ncbi:RNA pseudouridylate synthase domain containing protein 2 [Balamuthia mandrillaris]